MGWAQRRRDLGSLIFVWLRDRSGIVQAVFDQSKDAALFEKAVQIRSEFVLAVKGVVAARDEKNVNARHGDRRNRSGRLGAEDTELRRHACLSTWKATTSPT